MGGILLVALLGACTPLPTNPDSNGSLAAKMPASCAALVPCSACPVCAPAKPASTEAGYKEVAWAEIAAWGQTTLLPSLQVFIASCPAIQSKTPWQLPCSEALRLFAPDESAARGFFESRFVPYRITAPDGRGEGLITGYYEPILKGRRERAPGFRHPVYGVPDDLVVVDFDQLHPELRTLRLRGRLEGRRLVPYRTRAEIDRAAAPLPARPLVWVADAVELFFLQVQGSGQIELAPPAGICRPERPPLPVIGTLSRRPRRTQTGTSLDAVDQGMGGRQSGQIAGSARLQSELRVLS